jgi:hypothetical protein
LLAGAGSREAHKGVGPSEVPGTVLKDVRERVVGQDGGPDRVQAGGDAETVGLRQAKGRVPRTQEGYRVDREADRPAEASSAATGAGREGTVDHPAQPPSDGVAEEMIATSDASVISSINAYQL